MNDFFSNNYKEARANFLLRAHKKNAIVISYKHPMTGFYSEELYTDVACIGPKNAKNILIIVSGIHGAEGFCGSAIQNAFLNEEFHLDNTKVLLIHAINPFGFSYIQRENEDNIDLNRNFLEHNQNYPVNNEYNKISQFLIPKKWFSIEKKKADVELSMYKKNNEKEYFSAIYRGQYSHPDNLFFGGNHTTWSNITLNQIFKDFEIKNFSISFIDIHTGLGHINNIEIYPITPFNLLTNDKNILIKPFPYPTIGSLIHFMKEKFKDFLKIAFVVEYGTMQKKRSLVTTGEMDSLRFDLWIRRYGSSYKRLIPVIKDKIKDALCPNNNDWKKLAIDSGKKMIFSVINDLEKSIGVEGFEPPAYWSQTSRASQAALYPD